MYLEINIPDLRLIPLDCLTYGKLPFPPPLVHTHKVVPPHIMALYNGVFSGGFNTFNIDMTGLETFQQYKGFI